MESGDKLLIYQADNKLRTVEKIRSAIRLIEAELASEGFYPHNGGRLTRNEVCRRAGVAYSTLKNRTHLDTCAEVSRWFSRVAVTKADNVSLEDSKAAKIRDLTNMIDTLALNYDLFKVEFCALERRNEELEVDRALLQTRVTVLEREVARLKGAKNIIPLNRTIAS